jgi:hypothetical protein
MPKKPTRDNPRNRTTRTVQSAASVLRRLAGKQNAVSIPFENQVVESLRARLPEALREHVVEALEKADELVIFAESAAWAARVKLAIAADPGFSSSRRTVVKLAPRGASKRAS